MNNSQHTFKLDLFFELSPDILCIAGYDGFFKKVNPAFIDLLAYPVVELFAKPINEFVHSLDREITAANRKNIIEGIPLLNFENRYVSKNGEIFWLSWTSMPDKEEQLVYAIAKDITAKKKQELERNNLIKKLTISNRDLKQINYTTAHDLRTPVNNLLAVFSLLDNSKIEDQEILEFLEVLKLSVEELKTTLNNYVDALNQEDSKQVQLEELDLQDNLKEVLASIQPLMESSKAKIKTDFSELQTVFFNQAYLKSLFLNLMTNSIKYAKPGKHPEMYVYSRKNREMDELVFEDRGQGFDMDTVKDKVFGFKQKFHTHLDSKGIGLYLLYNQVTSLGGHIVLESKIGEGAKFIISFEKRPELN